MDSGQHTRGMEMNTSKYLTATNQVILVRMGCDERVPRNAVGYIDCLSKRTTTDVVAADALNQLARYIPDLVDAYIRHNGQARMRAE